MTASVPRTPSRVPPVRPSALPLSFRVEASLKLRNSLTVLVLSLLSHAGIGACPSSCGGNAWVWCVRMEAGR